MHTVKTGLIINSKIGCSIPEKVNNTVDYQANFHLVSRHQAYKLSNLDEIKAFMDFPG